MACDPGAPSYRRGARRPKELFAGEDAVPITLSLATVAEPAPSCRRITLNIRLADLARTAHQKSTRPLARLPNHPTTTSLGEPPPMAKATAASSAGRLWSTGSTYSAGLP